MWRHQICGREIISQKITRVLKKDKDKSVLSRADFAAMTLYGEESGAIAEGDRSAAN